MADHTEISQLIGRLRRAQPRNPDTTALCDWAESSITAPVALPATTVADSSATPECAECKRRRKQTAVRVAKVRGKKAGA